METEGRSARIASSSAKEMPARESLSSHVGRKLDVELEVRQRSPAMDEAIECSEILRILSDRLNEAVAANDAHRKRTCLESFEGSKLLIPPSEYVERIFNYSEVSESCILVAILYLERLKKKVVDLHITSTSIQRLLLVAVMIAAKFLEDRPTCNSWWALIGSISVAEINALERDFLFHVDFDLAVRSEDYSTFVDSLLWSETAAVSR
eukprot:CAMPEP_0113696040 /NCGR_PEP_ID=MMETSP0038_2-20120614/21251_1 /TAXON_ID=2898 /ORGANISM="Cryptomonas paramecium" /LENGTH=207 /DNA_ID=CAMNT_0000618683 /DNA_START=35 /DNA_END=654 /DNA_ORIENTATION=+ /assembly_acc=CAM_ASM_000170